MQKDWGDNFCSLKSRNKLIWEGFAFISITWYADAVATRWGTGGMLMLMLTRGNADGMLTRGGGGVQRKMTKVSL